MVGGSLSASGIVVLALVAASLLWFLSDPSVTIRGAQVLSQLLVAVGLLATAARLGLEGLCLPAVWPWLAAYACLVLAITAVWMRVVRRRPFRPSVPLASAHWLHMVVALVAVLIAGTLIGKLIERLSPEPTISASL